MLLSGVGHLNLGRSDGEDGDGMPWHQANGGSLSQWPHWNRQRRLTHASSQEPQSQCLPPTPSFNSPSQSAERTRTNWEVTEQQFFILHFLTIVKLDHSGHCLLPGAHCHVFLVCNKQLTPLAFCGACVWIGQCAQSWLFPIRKGRQKTDILLPRSIFAENWT